MADKFKRFLSGAVLLLSILHLNASVTDYVDPKIGSEGLGRVFIGPSMPYGMVKPSVDIARHRPIADGCLCPYR